MPTKRIATPARRLAGWPAALAVAAALLAGSQVPAAAQDAGPGLTTPTVFAPHDPGAPRCTAPAGLARSLAFAKDNERDFIQGVDRGLAMAARDRGLAYRVTQANNDADRMLAHLRELRADRTGGVVVAPVDPDSSSRSLQETMGSGAYVGTIVAPPATSLLNAPQYLTGKTLGDAAAAHIRRRLPRANVVLLTHDSIEFLTPRFVALRDALKTVPGAAIVADISPATVDFEGGFRTMQTILQAHPTIDVVLGADTVVLGALAALRAAGKDRPDQFLGGIDGEPGAVAEIKKRNSPYKASIALSSPVFGYAMGQHAADWLEGKSVPQGMDILPSALTIDNIARYEADLADPAAVYADPVRRASYLKMYGNICYDSRDRYVNFPWSSERK
ncbi:MAG TPA: sugar ABC transporter substrate-binding protein [Microvirga sp.]|jgi:ribose transport system substrate-binding protein|nr:sugar ABC transporter substrate-binding protein [Microvirga sp.]